MSTSLVRSSLWRLALLCAVIWPKMSSATPCVELRSAYQKSVARLQENQQVLLQRGCVDAQAEHCRELIEALREIQSTTIMVVQRMERLDCPIEGPTRAATPCERIQTLSTKSEAALQEVRERFQRRCVGRRRGRRGCRRLKAKLAQRRQIWRAAQARARALRCDGVEGEPPPSHSESTEESAVRRPGPATPQALDALSPALRARLLENLSEEEIRALSERPIAPSQRRQTP